MANLGLVVLKLAGGVLTGSAALLADGVNSLGDVASSIVVRGSLWVAQRDADDAHPYGHTKAESIAGLTVALMVAFSAAVLAVETVRGASDRGPPPTYLAGGVALLSSALKEALYRYTLGASRRLDSTVLRAASWDHRSDALGSAAIGGALLLGSSIGPAAWFVDPMAAIIVCGVLMFTGMRIYASTAAELMDQQADAEIVDDIALAARQSAQVCDVEKLRVRKSGLEYFVEIHIEVEGHLSVEAGHRIGHAVKDALMSRFPRVRDVLVHIEPHRDPP